MAIVLLFLTKPLSYMPSAVLSGVVFLIGVELVDYKGMQRIFRLRRGEFVVALITALTVIFVGVEQGVLLAILLSILEHVNHSYHPYDTLVGRRPDGGLTSVPLGTGSQVESGLLVYRFGASLYYANSSRFTEEIATLIEDATTPVRWLAIDAEAISDIDLQAADAIRTLSAELVTRNITIVVCRVSPAIQQLLAKYELGTGANAVQMFVDVPALVEAYKASQPQTT